MKTTPPATVPPLMLIREVTAVMGGDDNHGDDGEDQGLDEAEARNRTRTRRTTMMLVTI